MNNNLYSNSIPDSEVKILEEGLIQKVHTRVAFTAIHSAKIRLGGKTFIDTGSGPNNVVGLSVLNLGCSMYIPIDRAKALKKMMKSFSYLSHWEEKYSSGRNVRLIEVENLTGSFIKNINFETNSESLIFHTQMVLMHIKTQRVRISLIKEILKKGSTAIFTEPDWNTFNLLNNNPLLKEFGLAMKEFFYEADISGDYGGFMSKEINKVISENKLQKFIIRKTLINITDEDVRTECYKELIVQIDRSLEILNNDLKRNRDDHLVLKFEKLKRRIMIEKPKAIRPTFVSICLKRA